MRRALEEEVKKRVLEELEVKARELARELSNITDEEIAKVIREDREER